MQCDRCGERLIEIDRYGERLTGCIKCNRWSTDKCAYVVELSVEDFAALETLSQMVGKRGARPNQPRRNLHSDWLGVKTER
jgi:hypothetical protein